MIGHLEKINIKIKIKLLHYSTRVSYRLDKAISVSFLIEHYFLLIIGRIIALIWWVRNIVEEHTPDQFPIGTL